MLNTVFETSEFMRAAEKLLTEDERTELIDYLAENPTAGVIVRGAGGIRKLRWRRKDTGKSGGVRVIYFFHSETMPLYLITMFSKSTKVNLSAAERNQFVKVCKAIVAEYGKRYE